MNEALARALSSGHEDYDTLPPVIRQHYTLREWLWLSDAEKAGLVRHECEPDWTE